MSMNCLTAFASYPCICIRSSDERQFTRYVFVFILTFTNQMDKLNTVYDLLFSFFHLWHPYIGLPYMFVIAMRSDLTVSTVNFIRYTQYTQLVVTLYAMFWLINVFYVWSGRKVRCVCLRGNTKNPERM